MKVEQKSPCMPMQWVVGNLCPTGRRQPAASMKCNLQRDASKQPLASKCSMQRDLCSN